MRVIRAWVMNGNGVPIDLVTGAPAVINGSVTGSVGTIGREAYFNNSNSNYLKVASGTILAGKPNFAVLAVARTAQSSTTSGRNIYSERAATGNDLLAIQQTATVSGGVATRVAYRNDGGTLLLHTGATSISDSHPHAIMWTKTGSSGSSNSRLFVDGKLDGTGNFSSNDAMTDANLESRIGNDISNATSAWGDRISFIALVGSIVTDIEAMRLTAGEWIDLLIPIPKVKLRTWQPSAPAGFFSRYYYDMPAGNRMAT